MEKLCSKCGEEKPLDGFHRDAKRKDGLCPHCKACAKARAADWYQRNKERVAQQSSAWQKANREKERARCRAYHAANKEKVAESNRRWREKNPENERARAAKRRAGLNQRACLLTPDGEAKIKALYGFAAYLTEKFGQPYHVDHIVPLYGETCSGLHHPDNLRVIPAQLNLSKSNKIDYELVPHAFRPDGT